ncbi:acyl-CoA dehydrogenase family protein [Sphingobium sp. Sx8-8]|uniref:acyl-CoA dehydrogenase family protein n=1 Tax=Sphingobium sp. Sx8-8 TaxID=2933617 RepID=UPI001F5A9A4D|nr:acyl-CoA dehydrogenase family protein [Sphingobium sp. Sx8-8]
MKSDPFALKSSAPLVDTSKAMPRDGEAGTPVGYAALIERAEALVPLIAENAAEAERIGRTPDLVVAAMRDAGLFRMVRPSAFGGYAQPPEILFDVCSIVARGCMSTAWVLANLAVHELYMALWPRHVQEEVWSNPDTLIGSTFVFPAGRANKVEGGYIVNGRWPFSSGIHPCDWTINGAIVAGEDGSPPSQRYFLLSRDQYDILDTWHTEALRGTGSTDVAATDAFVSEDRTLGYVDLVQGKAPGLDVHSEASVRFPFSVMGGFVLLSAVYGSARGAYERFVEEAKTKITKSSGKGLAAEPTFQSKVAEAGALLDAVEALVRRNFADMNEVIAKNEPFTGRMAFRMRRDASFCAKLTAEAADLIFALNGGSALYKSNSVQRMWRDVHGGVAHIVFQWDVHGVASGKVDLGIPSGMPGMLV